MPAVSVVTSAGLTSSAVASISSVLVGTGLSSAMFAIIGAVSRSASSFYHLPRLKSDFGRFLLDVYVGYSLVIWLPTGVGYIFFWSGTVVICESHAHLIPSDA
jgi:hypothetical protein